MNPTLWQLDAEPEGEDAPPDPGVPHPPTIRDRQGAEIVPTLPGGRGSSVPPPADPPPSPLRIIEAMLFLGGPPLTAAKACSAVRGLTPDRFRDLADELARLYRTQRRPYSVLPEGDGYVVRVGPAYRGVRDRLAGGPREARLSGPAVEVLSLVAYRQPIPKSDVDALRGADSGGVLRQLVRLGLVASDGGGYATTPRFLRLFGLGGLDDLPVLGAG